MQIAGHDIGTVSWCFGAADIVELAARVKETPLQHVQLAFTPLVLLDDKRQYQQLGQLRASGLIVASGMINFPGEDYSTIDSIRLSGGLVPDALWTVRRKISQACARLAAQLGVRTITTHVGFVPPAGAASYSTMVGRVAEMAGFCADAGCDLLMETGQETAPELIQFMADVGAKNVGVNFDPANLILYGAGDPIAAVHTLGRNIRQVHLKDGVASDQPGKTWGKEVPFGQGQVNVPAFMKALHEIAYHGPLIFEREAGGNAAADIISGIAALRKALGA